MIVAQVDEKSMSQHNETENSSQLLSIKQQGFILLILFSDMILYVISNIINKTYKQQFFVFNFREE